MASFLANTMKARQLNGNAIDFDTDTIKVSLHTSSYTPNQDTHDFMDDVTNEIANGGGYTTGGVALAGKTVTQNNTSDRAIVDADDAAWTLTTTKTFRYAVVYKDTGVASTSAIIAVIDLLTDYTIANGTFTLQWDATNGIFYI